MNWKIITALLWKEWRETCWKWTALLISLHIPLLFFARQVAVHKLRKGPAEEMSYLLFNTTVTAPQFQAAFLLTGGLFLIGFFSAGIAAPELESRRIFLLFERPVRRSRILLLKFLVGASETLVSIALSSLITISIVFAGILMTSKFITLSISWRAFFRPLGISLQTTVVTGCAGLAVFSLAFLLSVLLEKWWVGVVTLWIALILFFNFSGYRFFKWVLRFDEVKWSLGNFTSVPLEQRSLAVVEYIVRQTTPVISPLPLAALLGMSIAFYLASLYFFTRKEMK
jgi:ABC-type transport system involved in multi-copper enzyme maturation permease subunit